MRSNDLQLANYQWMIVVDLMKLKQMAGRIQRPVQFQWNPVENANPNDVKRRQTTPSDYQISTRN